MGLVSLYILVNLAMRNGKESNKILQIEHGDGPCIACIIHLSIE